MTKNLCSDHGTVPSYSDIIWLGNKNSSLIPSQDFSGEFCNNNLRSATVISSFRVLFQFITQLSFINPGARSSRRINFVSSYLILVGPQLRRLPHVSLLAPRILKLIMISGNLVHFCYTLSSLDIQAYSRRGSDVA